jgi:hypothetical protein
MKRRIPVIYVAGPFRAATAWGVEENIRHAEEVGQALVEMGAMPLIPHAITRYLGRGEVPEEFFLQGTLELLRRCNAATFIDGWRGSAGSRDEYAEAERLALPKFEWTNWEDRARLRRWIAEHREAA